MRQFIIHILTDISFRTTSAQKTAIKVCEFKSYISNGGNLKEIYFTWSTYCRYIIFKTLLDSKSLEKHKK